MVIDIKDAVSEDKGPLVCGDLHFRILNAKNNNLICRFGINTSYVDGNTNTYILKKESVDPDSIKKSNKYDPEFSVTIHFEDECKNCRPT
jgi:hypothetical protein